MHQQFKPSIIHAHSPFSVGSLKTACTQSALQLQAYVCVPVFTALRTISTSALLFNSIKQAASLLEKVNVLLFSRI